MVKIAVSGGLGRMGKRICRLIDKEPDAELVAVIERPGHPDIDGESYGAAVTSDISEVNRADVVIDFSLPDQTMKILGECLRGGAGLVIGTTGLNGSQVEEVRTASEKTAVLLSPNMSVGVNLLFKLAGEITDRLPGFEKEIVEAHHNRKVDAPSGTALKIAEMISREGDKTVTGRSGSCGPRRPGEIGLHAIRGGSITGEHTVMWIGEHERIELFHRAETRDIFASGALRAALWLNTRKAGKLYSMEDVLR